MPTDDQTTALLLSETIRLSAEIKALAALNAILLGALRANDILPGSAVPDLLALAEQMTPNGQNTHGQALLALIASAQCHVQGPPED